MNNSIKFGAEASGDGQIDRDGRTATGQARIWISYFYNFGYGGRASCVKWFKYDAKPNDLWAGLGHEIKLWELATPNSISKRQLPLFMDDGRNNSLGLDEEWQTNSFADNETLNYRQRLDISDISAFGRRLLTFNDGGRCGNGGCRGNTCDRDPDKPCHGGVCPLNSRFVTPPPSEAGSDPGDSAEGGRRMR